MFCIDLSFSAHRFDMVSNPALCQRSRSPAAASCSPVMIPRTLALYLKPTLPPPPSAFSAWSHQFNMLSPGARWDFT